jgi:hypothetical protein
MISCERPGSGGTWQAARPRPAGVKRHWITPRISGTDLGGGRALTPGRDHLSLVPAEAPDGHYGLTIQ